jgi:hypothetical protein
MNSSKDSEKSVVIQSLLKAEPNASGCDVVAIPPLGLTLSVSRSTPCLILGSADKKAGWVIADSLFSNVISGLVKFVFS